MKTFTKVSALLLAFLIAFALCSCGSDGGKTGGESKTEAGKTSAAPEWINGAWSYASYDGEGGAFSGFHREAVRLTVIDDTTLLYEEFYYPDPEHPDWKDGVDYSFEREYYYDRETDCVFIKQTDTGVFEGKVFSGSHDTGFLKPVRIERKPDKDRLTEHPAARFVLNPKELTGKDSGESSGNLRFNRDIESAGN